MTVHSSSLPKHKGFHDLTNNYNPRRPSPQHSRPQKRTRHRRRPTTLLRNPQTFPTPPPPIRTTPPPPRNTRRSMTIHTASTSSHTRRLKSTTNPLRQETPQHRTARKQPLALHVFFVRCAEGRGFAVGDFDDVGGVGRVAERRAGKAGGVDGDGAHGGEEGDHEFVAAGLAEGFVGEVGL